MSACLQEILKSISTELFTLRNIKGGFKAALRKRGDNWRRPMILLCIFIYMLDYLISRIYLLIFIPFVRYK